MTWLVLLLNVPLMVLFFALWVGVPIWLVLRHSDAGPTPPAKRLHHSGARRIHHDVG
jgi:hypothetical protein